MHVQDSALVPPAHGARAVHAMKHAKLPPGLAKTAPGLSHQPPAVHPSVPKPTLTPMPKPPPPATSLVQAASTPPATELPAEQPYTSITTETDTALLPAPVVATLPRAREPALEASPPEGEQETDTPLTLHGLLKNWGHTDSPYDLNADGIVNVLDLIEFLMDYPGPDDSAPADHDPSQDSVARNARRDAVASLAQQRQKLGQVADSLLGGLVKAGFGEHPPPGIHDLVDALQLSGRQKQLVMRHLDAHYHNGLGVNMVG